MGAKHGKITDAEADLLAEKTHFTPKEVVTWHAEFMRDCPKGRLTRAEFNAIFAEIFPFGASGEFAEMIFSVYDRSKDRRIQFEEFIQALSTVARGTIDEKLSFAFKLYDRNRDGLIDRVEMAEVVAAAFRMIGGGGADDDGGDNSAETKVMRIFEAFGMAHRASLTEDEFRACAKNNAEIMHALSLYGGLV